MSSEIQSVIFSTEGKENTWTQARARVWLKDNNLRLLKGKKVDVTSQSIRYRINDPKKYIEFRTKQGSDDRYGKISFVIGILGLKEKKKPKKRKKKKRVI